MSRPLECDVQRIIKLQKKGLTFRQIAERLNMSYESVRRRLDPEFCAAEKARRREEYELEKAAGGRKRIIPVRMIISPWVEERIGPYVAMSRTVRGA